MGTRTVAKVACVIVSLGAVVAAALADSVWSKTNEARDVILPPENETREEAGLNEPRAASQSLVIEPPNYWDTGSDDVPGDRSSVEP